MLQNLVDRLRKRGERLRAGGELLVKAAADRSWRNDLLGALPFRLLEQLGRGYRHVEQPSTPNVGTIQNENYVWNKIIITDSLIS